MKKLIMIAIAILALHQINVFGSNSSTSTPLALNQTQTYYQSGSSMLEDGLIYNNYDGTAQFVVNRSGSTFMVNTTSSDTQTYTEGAFTTEINGKTFEDSLRNNDNGGLSNDAMAFEGLFFWTIEGNVLYNALYQQKDGTIVNNITKLILATTPKDGTVSYQKWPKVSLKTISLVDFIKATNSTLPGGGSVLLNDQQTTYNSIFSTAQGNGKYYYNCQTTALGTYIGLFSLPGGTTQKVYGTLDTTLNHADYTKWNSTLNGLSMGAA